MTERNPLKKIERRTPETLLSELTQVLRRYSQEDSDVRFETFERHLLPRLRVFEQAGKTIGRDNRTALQTLLNKFIEQSSAGPEFLKTIEAFNLTPLLEAPIEIDETDEAYEHLPLHSSMRAEHSSPRQQEATGHDKRQTEVHRQARQTAERNRWEDMVMPEPLEIPLVKDPVPPLHEQLLAVQGFRGMTADQIFGPDLQTSVNRRGESNIISRDPALIEARLTAIQASRSSSELVNSVLQYTEQYLRKHLASVRTLESIQSRSDHENFPQDDQVDAVMRTYLKALLDWFPHVYNTTLDYPERSSVPKGLRRQDLKLFLMDGLTKSLNVVYRVFVRDAEQTLGRELNLAVDQLVRDHYYAKPRSLTQDKATAA